MAPVYKQIFIGLLLTLLSHRTIARQEYAVFIPRQELAMALEDFDSSEEDYSDLKKYGDNNPNFLSKWPWLREIVPDDYETSTNNIQQYPLMDNIEPPASSVHRRTPAPKINSPKKPQQKKNSNSRKEYMSPCHFKICNMGRKRSARFMHL